MADEFAARLTGASMLTSGGAVMLNVMMTDQALLAGGDEPAVLPGNLPMPAPLARRMITDLPEAAEVFIRRLYTHPETGEVLAMDARRRTFPPLLRQLLVLRDQTCRTPYCDATARHADHLTPASAGGVTSIGNGQMLSEDCNYIRTSPGWSAEPSQQGSIVVTTPTGHRYRSPGAAPIPPQRSSIEAFLRQKLARAG